MLEKKNTKGKKLFLVVGGMLLLTTMLAGFFYLVVTHDYSGNPPISVENCTNPYIIHNGKPKVTAHRSGGGIAPENTMLAFENVIRSREFYVVDYFEFDVQLTKDKQLVLLHDPTLDRTSNAAEFFGKKNVQVSQYTYEELRELNMGENFVTDTGEMPYRGLRGSEIPDNLRIARLEDAVEYLTNYREFDFIVEIKEKNRRGREACDEVYRILKENDLLGESVICSFNSGLCKYIDRRYPDLARTASHGEILGFYVDSLFNIYRPEGYYKFVTLLIPDDNYIIKLGTTRVVNYAHAHDIAVHYWTINDEDKVRELAAKGEDAIISDFPDMAFRVLNELE